jgi:magnesium-protoporphyrin IX monomethyl ester (oxidative) cyclase
MYVRDHARPEFHKAIGIDPAEFGMKVFRITTEISRQVFPISIDIDHPDFMPGLERLRVISDAMNENASRTGIGGRLKNLVLGARAGIAFLRLFMIPTKTHDLPDSSRLMPAW